MVTDEVSEASAYHLKFEDDYESWYQVEAGSLREMLEGGKFARKQRYRSVALGSAAKPSATDAAAKPSAKTVADPALLPGVGTTSTFDAAVSGLSGKRKVVPTQVKIGNQYVKRQNLYDMDTGETSAFKLDDSYDAAFVPQERPTPAALPPPPAAASKPNERPPQQPRQQSAAEQRRLQTNEALRRDAAAMAQCRARFFHEHRARIEPFCEPTPAQDIRGELPAVIVWLDGGVRPSRPV